MTPGTQLGPYRVESLIGAGGMGEVYLGTDTRLDRQVAIKILPKLLARDNALRERFEREARTISSLSHPNICTLFDIGRENDSDFLVMEYLQGETLAERISRGPLQPQQVVKIGLEIAHALEAAHRQGIVHRDLKPGNIMVARGGVKLLDFGLAKLSTAASMASDTAIAFMATEQKPLTEQGSILGTFQYMAPEQLEGREADARSDIFAFGAILYEMATGQRAFSGTSKASLIAAIIDREPRPIHEIQPLTPAAIERLVAACLAKDPEDRIQTAHDIALQLGWLGESSSIQEPIEVRRRRQMMPWFATALAALLAVTGGVLWWLERVKPESPYSLSIVPPVGYNIAFFALSPDGKALAFTASAPGDPSNSLWVRHLETGEQRQVAPIAAGQSAFWSPDSQWVGFFDENEKMMRVRAEGGRAEVICRSPHQGIPAWSEDGTILFTPRFGYGLSRVPAAGGDPVVVTKPDAKRQESFHGHPKFVDGRRYLYSVHTIAEKRNEIWAGSLDDEERQMVMNADALVGYSKPYLLFVRDGAIFAQKFDASKLRPTGEARRVVDNVRFHETEVVTAASVARNGALAYMPDRPIRRLMNTYDRRGVFLSTLWAGEDAVAPQLSRDEQTLVVAKHDAAKGAHDIHAVDLTRGIATRLTKGLASYLNPVISPDGQWVAYQSDAAGMFDIYVQSIDGASGERKVWVDNRDKGASSWSPDGRNLVVSQYGEKNRNDLWIVPVDPSQPRTLFVGSEHSESAGVFSPDGRAIAYLSDQAGDPEIFVRPYPTGRSVRVSTDGGSFPSWSSDGREILWSSRKRIMAASIDLSGPVPQVGPPKQLFTLPRVWSSPVPMKDGRILVAIPDPDAVTLQPVELTTAWRLRMDDE